MQGFPLIYADKNKYYLVDKIFGDKNVVKHLTDIGFTHGAKIKIVHSVGNGLVVSILNTTLALDFSTAKNIYVAEMQKDKNIER